MVQIGKKAAAGPKKGKKALTFTIDCSKPVEDKVRGEPGRHQCALQAGAAAGATCGGTPLSAAVTTAGKRRASLERCWRGGSAADDCNGNAQQRLLPCDERPPRVLLCAAAACPHAACCGCCYCCAAACPLSMPSPFRSRQIMEIASFEKFLVDKIKVQGKTGEPLLLPLPSLGLVCVCCCGTLRVAVVCTACVCCPLALLVCVAVQAAVWRLMAARQQRRERGAPAAACSGSRSEAAAGEASRRLGAIGSSSSSLPVSAARRQQRQPEANRLEHVDAAQHGKQSAAEGQPDGVSSHMSRGCAASQLMQPSWQPRKAGMNYINHSQQRLQHWMHAAAAVPTADVAQRQLSLAGCGRSAW